MDPVTQAALGAAAAQSASKPARFVAATWVGALAGFLPDADVLIRSSSDPLLFLDYHRHFTHSLAFIPIGGALVAWLCSKFSRGRLAFREALLPASLGWASHGLLDSCTSYGTYLYWPFSNERVAWHLVSIIDPLFTVPLVIGAIWAFRRRAAKIARLALLLALGYLALGSFQLQRAESVYAEFIAQRGHNPTVIEAKPSLGNNILFRAFYLQDGSYYADAVRVPWVGTPKVYEGQSHPALDVKRYSAEHNLSAIHQADLARFEYFSAGYLVADPRDPGIVSDFRYAAVPNQIAPLWGVDVLGTPAGRHLAWRQFRDIDADDRSAFLDMLWGR